MTDDALQKYDSFKSFFTYEDALTYALALTDEESFDMNPDKWHQAIYDICQKYRDRIPELKWIYFTSREPMPPRSDQVDQLMKLLPNSREASILNPDFPTISISQEKRELIKRREEKRLAQYKEELLEISAFLKERLRVPQDVH